MKKLLRLCLTVFLISSVTPGFSQGGNTCAQAASSPVTLPFSAGGQSTCGSVTDNFNGTVNCTSVSSAYTTGPDYFYVFTAPSTGNVPINLTNIVPASHWGSIIVFQGCPAPAGAATNCVAGTSASSGNLSLLCPVTAGQTYYVMIDDWPTPACIDYSISIGSVAAPQGGDLCSNAINVTTPYCGTGQTTCGMSDNFNGTINCGAPSSAYTTGPDVFYSFTASTSGSYQVQLTNTSGSHFGSIIVFQGCPSSSSNATNCVAGTSATSGNFGLSFNATAGVTYYVMIDNWPSPPCFNYDICIQPTPTSSLQPPCTNLGFESGTTGWFGTNGTVSNGGVGAPSPIYNPSSFGVFAPQTTVMTGGTDTYGGFPTVFAGANSLQIGDGAGTNYGGASVEQLFQVTSANSNFTYNYAVVLQDGGHANYEQPFFQVEVFDGSNNPIACGNYLITAPGTGFIQSTVDATVWYKTWTPVSINLIGYIGQNVRIKFTSGDCSQGGHFGYAYVDCSCASYTIAPITICKGSSGTLNAPTGALSYSWTPGGQTTASVVVSPTVTTVYTVNITSQGTTPCSGIMTTTVTVLPSPTVTATSATVCVGQGGTLTASGASTYTWSPATGLSSTTGATVTASPSVTTNYTVTGSNGSCATTGTCAVTVIPTPTVTVNSPTICKTATVALNASGATTSYSWTPSTGLSATTGSTVIASPTVTTTYTIIGTSGSCTTTATSTVTVNPTPTVTVNSPTICKNATVTLSAGGANTYTWSPGTGLSSTNGASVTANPTVTTVYTITATSVAGCTATATSTVTVNPTPTVTVNSPTICKNATVTLSASGANTYTWSPGTGLSSTTGASVTANPTVTTVYTITASSVAGCTATATSTVTVNPTPTITVNSPTICKNATVTLTAGGASTYTWSPGTGLSSTTGASVTANPTVTTVYTITASSVAGCTATATSTVTVNPTPTITVNSPTICINASTTLNAGGASTYTWSPGTGLSGTTGASVTANPTVTTTYTITGTSALSCTATATSTVTVNPNPTVTVNSPSICVNGSTTLNAGGASTYSWSPGTGLSGTTGASVTANPTVTTIYTVTGTSAATCTSTATSTVTVNPTPTITVGSATMCPGNSTTLTASGANTYTWSPGTGLSGTTGASVTASPTVTTTYTITGTSVAGCTATATSTVTIGGSIVPSVNSATICMGQQTATLTATGGATYTWSPGTGLSGTTGATVTANPTVTTTYTITAASGGCTGTTTAAVTVNPLPTVTVNSPTFCSGNSATLNASGASTYTWSPGTGLSATTGASVTANPTVTTTYTITGASVAGCTSTATSTVTVNPTPTVAVNSGTICNGGSVALTATGANTYTWSPGTGLSSTTGANVTANPTVTTTYTITGASAAGCTATATSTVTVVTNPTVTVASATICINGSTTLNASGASTYTWSPGTGLSSTTGASVTANPTVTTTYTITGTAGTCTALTTATVTVNPLPVVTVNSGTICVNNSTTLTAGGASTYTWSPSTGLSSSTGASVTANPTVTTNYTVTGTSAAGCVNTSTTAVTVNPLPTVNVTNGTVCNGGSATLTASGASTYTWSPATGLSSTTGASVTANPTVTTNYTITGTDANGCVNTNTTSVTVVTNPTVTVASATICINSSTTLNANGATTYTWSPGTGLSSTTGASVTANPTVTTTYTITGTAGTCTAVTTAIVTVNPLPVVTVNSGTICLGQQTATLTSGGASTYTWSPATGLSSANGSPVTANPTTTTSYTVTGTDANGCVNTETTTVTVNPLPTLALTSGFICNGSTATLTATGASTYTWSPATGLSSTTGSSVTGTPGSTTQYTVTGTDANGCVDSDTTSITVVNNPTVTVASATICINSSTTLTANGAQTYVWSPGTGLSSTTGSSVTANPTSTTVYTITGTAGTCTAVTTATVTVNPLPVVSVNSGTICLGQQTATLTAGGASTYTWSPATGLSSANGSPVTANPTTTTSYTVTGTDANGCVNTATTTVTVNPLPTLALTSGFICNGSTATLTATGASTYTWSPATGLSSTTGSSVTGNPGSTTQYTVTGTDANGCVDSDTTSITVVNNPTVTVASATICINSSTTLTANGAQTYVWSPGIGLSSTTGSSVTANPTSTTVYTITGTAGTCTAVTTATVTVNPLPVVTVNSGTICLGQQTTTLTAGGASTYTWSPATGLSSANGSPVTANPTTTTSYTVTGTDANGCVNTETTTVTVNPLPTLALTSGFICNGSTATLTATGASTYTWSPATGLSSTTGSSVTGNPGSTTQYTVTGTDANGCVDSDTTSITVVNNPTVTVTSATICIGDSTTLTANGAQTYVWTPGTGLSSTSGTSVTANPTSTTVYTITGTAGTCTAVTTATVTVNPLPVVTVNSGTICVGQQTATLTAGGASTYTWSPATGLSSSTGSPVTANPTTTTSYTVTGTDANGCVNTETTTVTVNPLPIITVNSDLICVGGSTTLNAGGASTYVWSPGTGLSSTTGSSVTANPASTTVYTVTGTDVNGCYDSSVSTVTVVSNPTVTVNAPTICIGDSVTLTANGASTYVWSPGTGLSSTTGSSVTANPTSTTVYTITGTAGTCTAVATTTVTVNPLPVITVNSGTICVGQQTATLTAGGASTYTWSPATGLSSANGSPVTANPTTTTSYTVKGTDANGCVNTETTTVTVNPLPIITVNSDLICVGGSTTLNAGGASTYVWSPGTGLSSTTGSSVTANPASTTVYTVTGTDANGCYDSSVSTVTVVANPTVTVASATICINSSTTLNATGAGTYVWSPGTGLSSTTGSSVTANPLTTTDYTITGTAGTCTAVTTATVTVNPLPVVTASSNTPCVNQNISLTSSGGTVYSWSGPNGFSSSQQNPGINGVTLAEAGVYTVTVTDANTCVNTATVNVVVNSLPVVVATGATVCVTQTINLGCNNSGVTYSWTGPNTFSSNQQNPSIPNAATNMSGSYVVTVTDANGCASGNVANVVVNPALSINATNNGPICQNSTLVLATGAGVSWSWSGPNGFSSVSQTPTIPNAQPNATGTYTVVGTDVNGCTGTATTSAIVNPLPIVTVNSGTICVTQQLATLTAVGASTYSWSPASTLSSATGSPVSASPMVTTVYTVTGVDANNCANTATSTVTVNQLPTVTANSAVICFGNSATLTGNGASTYSWSPATGLSSSTGSPVTANPSSTTSYTLTGIDANGCYNTGVCSVTVNPLPNVSANSASICSGATTTLNALGANTYSWTPATGLNTSSAASVAASPAATTTYVVTGTDINGCSNSDTVIVTVNPLPIVNLSPQNATGCAPVCVNLTNTSSSSGNCSWSFGDGSSSSNCAPSHCYLFQGSYNPVLTLTDSNGCVGTGTANVTVYPIPDADFSFGPQPATIFESTINFYDLSSGAFITNWNWTFGDPQNSSSTVQNPAFNYYDAGTYAATLVVTSNFGCTDSVTKTVVIGEDFMIYVPNAFSPNFDGVNDVFMAKGEGIKEFNLFIFDRWGNQVFYSDDIYKGWDGRFQAKGETIVQEDVYVWKIELKNYKNEPRQLKGTVSLIK